VGKRKTAKPDNFDPTNILDAWWVETATGRKRLGDCTGPELLEAANIAEQYRRDAENRSEFYRKLAEKIKTVRLRGASVADVVQVLPIFPAKGARKRRTSAT
jgi:hypothetical protein